MSISFTPRRIDHIVMPVVSLGASRSFFEALGFTVAPPALHPFGTENACVFFADGTYLEPLGVASPATYAAAAQGGNVFVRRDEAFRFRRTAPGFSGIAFRSDDAEADWQGFHAAGLADGELFQFARLFEAPDGTKRELVFRLAFASDRRSPDLFFFAVQAVSPSGDRSALSRHANGANGIAGLVLSDPRPHDFEPFLQGVTGQPSIAGEGDDLQLDTANGRIDVLTPSTLSHRYGGAEGSDERGLRLQGVALGVPDLGPLEERALRAGMATRRRHGRLVVPLAGDAGPFLAFETAAGGS